MQQIVGLDLIKIILLGNMLSLIKTAVISAGVTATIFSIVWYIGDKEWREWT
jgi:hypothetical protein